MMKSSAGLASKAIEGILELSAEAHIKRRRAVRSSPAFHTLTGAIAAYGRALAILVTLQEEEEFYALMDELELPEAVSGQVH